MNSSRGSTTEEELERYRARCQSLETYLSDLQLELRRLQHQQTAALALQRKFEDQLATVQLEVRRKESEAAALRKLWLTFRPNASHSHTHSQDWTRSYL